MLTEVFLILPCARLSLTWLYLLEIADPRFMAKQMGPLKAGRLQALFRSIHGQTNNRMTIPVQISHMGPTWCVFCLQAPPCLQLITYAYRYVGKDSRYVQVMLFWLQMAHWKLTSQAFKICHFHRKII